MHDVHPCAHAPMQESGDPDSVAGLMRMLVHILPFLLLMLTALFASAWGLSLFLSCLNSLYEYVLGVTLAALFCKWAGL